MFCLSLFAIKFIVKYMIPETLGQIIFPEQVKVKVKFSLEQVTKAQRGSNFIASLFLQPRR